MRSLSEIDTVSKRSSRAAGYSWGIAEEIGKNIRLLEIFSLPGIKNLNSFFKKKKELRLENISIIKQDNEAGKNEYCPIIAGVNFLDQIKTLETINEITEDKLLKVGVAENGEDIFKKVTEVRRTKVRAFEPEFQPEIYTGLENKELDIRNFKVDLATKQLVQLSEQEQMERALARQARPKGRKLNRLNSAKEVIDVFSTMEVPDDRSMQFKLDALLQNKADMKLIKNQNRKTAKQYTLDKNLQKINEIIDLV